MDSWSGNGGKNYYSGKSSGTENTGNFSLKFDGNAIDYSAMKSKTYSDFFTGSGTNSDDGYAEIGAISLTAGTHDVVFTRLDSYNVLVKSFVIIY